MYRVSNALIKKLAIIFNNTLHNTQYLCTDHINLRCMFHYNIILPICTYYSPFSHFLLLFAGNIPEKCFLWQIPCDFSYFYRPSLRFISFIT